MCRAIKGGELANSFEQWLVHTVNTFKTDRSFNNIHSICEPILLLIKWQKKQKSAIQFNFVKQEKYQTISC
jgi:hypothetical protein